eukprot:scaffold1375_cov137-Cylindrotheca_fusiformis.AAC.12
MGCLKWPSLLHLASATFPVQLVVVGSIGILDLVQLRVYRFPIQCLEFSNPLESLLRDTDKNTARKESDYFCKLLRPLKIGSSNRGRSDSQLEYHCFGLWVLHHLRSTRQRRQRPLSIFGSSLVVQNLDQSILYKFLSTFCSAKAGCKRHRDKILPVARKSNLRFQAKTEEVPTWPGWRVSHWPKDRSFLPTAEPLDGKLLGTTKSAPAFRETN